MMAEHTTMIVSLSSIYAKPTKAKEEYGLWLPGETTADSPRFRVDEFANKEDAVAFIKRIEPTTPLISLRGQSPEKPLDYDSYCRSLTALGLPTSLEIYEMNRERQREIVVDELTREEMETEP